VWARIRAFGIFEVNDMKTRLIWTLALVGLLLGMSGTAHAFSVLCRYGGIMRWSEATASWATGGVGTDDVDGDGEWAAVEAAFTAWGSIPCTDITFNRVEHVESPELYHREGEYILVYFESNEGWWRANCYDPGSGHTCVGYRFFGSAGANPEFLYGTIVLNDYEYDWSTDDDGAPNRLDIQSVVTTMLANMIGLDDAEEGADSVTTRMYNFNDVSCRTLGTDDIEAMQYLYRTTRTPAALSLPPTGSAATRAPWLTTRSTVASARPSSAACGATRARLRTATETVTPTPTWIQMSIPTSMPTATRTATAMSTQMPTVTATRMATATETTTAAGAGPPGRATTPV
jgi:hypothetical protein